MELNSEAVETVIESVLTDICQKGYSSVQPFSIGKVEERMMQFAYTNAITLASDELYMSAKQLQHCMRASKATKGLVVTDDNLIGFPQNRFQISKNIKSWPHVTSCILVKETKRQGRIAHHLCVSAAMPPFRTSWLYLASPFTLQR